MAGKRLTCATAKRPQAIFAGVESTLAHVKGMRFGLLRFIVLSPNAELYTVDIVEKTEGFPFLKLKIGGANLVIEKSEDWKHHTRNLLERFDTLKSRHSSLTDAFKDPACEAVRDHRVKGKHRSGDILYASLVSVTLGLSVVVSTFLHNRCTVFCKWLEN